jgi:Zn-dependent peptidase ImmA (M78 family)
VNFLLSKVKKYGINERPQTEKDFHEICEAEGIEVIWSNDKFSWYMTVEHEPFIVLPKRKRGIKLLFDMFHELAHHFAHYGDAPNQVFFHGLTDDKNEFEADMMALIALIPLKALDSFDFLEDNPSRFAKKLYKERQRLYFLYGI